MIRFNFFNSFTKTKDMKKIVGLLIGLLLIVSCSGDDAGSVNNEVLIKEYNPLFMFYNHVMPTNTLIKLEYDSNARVVKRIGGFLHTSANSFFSDKIYDEVSYTDNEIIVEKKTTSTEFQVDKFIRTYRLNNGKIVEKTIDRGQSNNRVYTYEYNAKNRISKMEYKTTFSSDESNFYYSTKNNLDSIVTKKYYINSQNQKEYTGKVVKAFSGYDTAKNPLKQLVIFEEVFNRSLSENNFAKYVETSFNKDNENTYVYEAEWQMSYDPNGNINFSKTK